MIRPRHAVGVDGAGSGWFAVWRDRSGLGWDRYADAASLWSAHAKAEAIGVDVPIGLGESGPRPSDHEARRFVGGARSPSIFPAPLRAVLDCTTRAEASSRQRAIDGRGLSAQAFALFPKIRDWDALLQRDAIARLRVHEVHPEVCFAAMNGGAGLGLVSSKRTEAGHRQRLQLLSPDFGQAAIRSVLDEVPKRIAQPDDILDAIAALWTAERLVSGLSQSLPNLPPTDRTGLTMAIRY